MCCSNRRRNGCNTSNTRAVIYTPATTTRSTTPEATLQYQQHRQPSPEAMTEGANGEILQRVGIEPPSYDTAVFDSDFGEEPKQDASGDTARAVFIQGEERQTTSPRRVSGDSPLSSPLSSSSSSSLESGDSWITGDKAWRKLEKRAWKAERKAEKRAWKAARKAAKAERKAMC